MDEKSPLINKSFFIWQVFIYCIGNTFNQPFPRSINESHNRLSTDMLIRLFDVASFLIGNLLSSGQLIWLVTFNAVKQSKINRNARLNSEIFVFMRCDGSERCQLIDTPGLSRTDAGFCLFVICSFFIISSTFSFDVQQHCDIQNNKQEWIPADWLS